MDMKQLDAEDAMWQCLEGRQQDARHIREGRQGRREKGRTRRLAHRSREQNTLRKLLVASEAVLKMQGGNREMLGVEIVCLRQLDMNDLAEQWSRGHLGRLVNTPEWKRAVKCLGAWQRASLEALTEAQLHIQKRRLEQQEWKQCQGGQGGLQWFTGKKRHPPPQPKTSRPRTGREVCLEIERPAPHEARSGLE